MRAFPPQLRTLLFIDALKPLAVVTIIAAAAGVGLGFAVHLVAGLAFWLLVVAVSVAFTIWWSRESWARRSWMVGATTVELQIGVFWRRHVVLPRNRVQNVTIATGPLRSYLELVTVTVHSAGAATPNVSLLGVTAEEGEWLQRELLGARS